MLQLLNSARPNPLMFFLLSTSQLQGIHRIWRNTASLPARKYRNTRCTGCAGNFKGAFHLSARVQVVMFSFISFIFGFDKIL